MYSANKVIPAVGVPKETPSGKKCTIDTGRRKRSGNRKEQLETQSTKARIVGHLAAINASQEQLGDFRHQKEDKRSDARQRHELKGRRKMGKQNCIWILDMYIYIQTLLQQI